VRIAALVAVLVLVALGAGAYNLTTRAVDLTARAQHAVLEAALPEHEVFETERGQVHRYSGGEGSVLVLVHGFGDTAGGWALVAPTLAEHYRVVAVDLPGHGASEPEAPPLGFDDVAAGLEAALEDQGDQLILLGNSLGGWVAMQFALDHPARVQRLLLLNSGGASWAQVDQELLLPTTREQQRAKNRAIMGASAPPLPGFFLDQLIERGSEPRLQSLWIEHQQGHYLDERLSELRIPVDMLWGTPDPIFPIEGYADRLRDALPNARLRLLNECGHAPQYSCPDDLSELVLELLTPAP
jgi:pimeloyl-ACP methyl ester carboxylesterase